MRVALKPGDRVQVTKANRVPGYQPGDMGTLLWVAGAEGEVNHFVVVMDRDTEQPPVVFTVDEINAET
jgi:hypothetical protein